MNTSIKSAKSMEDWTMEAWIATGIDPVRDILRWVWGGAFVGLGSSFHDGV